MTFIEWMRYTLGRKVRRPGEPSTQIPPKAPPPPGEYTTRTAAPISGAATAPIGAGAPGDGDELIFAIGGFRAALRALVDMPGGSPAMVSIRVNVTEDGAVTMINVVTLARLEVTNRAVKLLGPGGTVRMKLGELS